MSPPNTSSVAPARGDLSNVTIESDRDALNQIFTDPAFAELEAYPHIGVFGRAYHPAIHGKHDCSFVVCAGGVPALICLCAPLNGKLSFYGMPLRFVSRSDLDCQVHHAVLQSAFQYLDKMAAARGLHEILVIDEQREIPSAIEEACYSRGGTKSPHCVAYVDLTAGPAAWRSALRKSSRSLINWGRRNLSIVYLNKENPDRALFDQYRAFHAEVAGRVTRGVDSWNVMYEWIIGGGGELILAFLEERLVAGSMFIDGTSTSIYASAVYDRTQFDKPLAHYPVWLGIERAHARGMERLELGPVPAKGTVPEKEYQIGYFKRGFATHIETQTVWRWVSTDLETFVCWQ
jgi:hypothetical protein